MSFRFIALLLPFLALHAQDHGNDTPNPYNTPQDIMAGSKLFRAACSACHGLEGAGGSNGPSLTSGVLKHGGTNQALQRVIAKGVPDTPMAPYPLKEREIWQLVAHIQDLNLRKGSVKPKGDHAKGAQLFSERGCVRCHTAGGPGGFLGPDLSQIGARRNLAQLERSVIDPNAEVLPDFWTLRARSKSGQSIVGIRLNEDSDSFQYREPSGRLRTLWKSELSSFELDKTTPMPSFKDKLDARELEDLVAFLARMGGPQQ